MRAARDRLQQLLFRADAHRASVVASAVLAVTLSGCGLIGIASDECTGPEPPAPSEPLSPIALALRYLDFAQAKADYRLGNIVEYAGNWPQCYGFDRDGPFVRDVNPYAVACIHHALSLVTQENRDALGLTGADIDTARAVRARAIELMQRFQAKSGTSDAGTFGFWVSKRQGWRPGDLLLATLVELRFGGPKLHGYRVPANISFFPESFEIPTDADTTSVVYAALLDHAILDGGPPVSPAFERYFSDWRDLGRVPQRNDQPWIPDHSGAFLTWLAYRDDPDDPNPNDVDVLVNANVLYALGRFGRLDTPGVSDAVAVINNALRSGGHLTDPHNLSQYYSDVIIAHYLVTRAYREGDVVDLAPAADLLAEDLLNTVVTDAAGRHFWDRGDPHLNTAFAVLALLNAERSADVVRSAVDYLAAAQNPITGAWEPGFIYAGRLDNGAEPVWLSTAFTTAIALEALCRYQLSAAGS